MKRIYFLFVFTISVSAFDILLGSPLIFMNEKGCWIISASEIVKRGKFEPEVNFVVIPIFKGKGERVEFTELRKLADVQHKGESILQFCALKAKGQTRQDIFFEVINFYKLSFLANRDVSIADRVDSDGTSAEVTYEIKIGNANISLIFIIPDSERLDWDSNDIRKIKIKNTSAPIYFDLDIEFVK